MREVSPEEGDQLSFFLYEELLAFKRAAEICGLTRQQVEAVLYGNAMCLLGRL
jgi:hypothetical protein